MNDEIFTICLVETKTIIAAAANFNIEINSTNRNQRQKGVDHNNLLHSQIIFFAYTFKFLSLNFLCLLS